MRTKRSYVDVTADGVTVSIPCNDPEEIERILKLAAPPMAGITEPNVANGFTSGAIVIDAPEETETAKKLAEELLLEAGFDI